MTPRTMSQVSSHLHNTLWVKLRWRLKTESAHPRLSVQAVVGVLVLFAVLGTQSRVMRV